MYNAVNSLILCSQF